MVLIDALMQHHPHLNPPLEREEEKMHEQLD
jgi:hypothetical protein